MGGVGIGVGAVDTTIRSYIGARYIDGSYAIIIDEFGALLMAIVVASYSCSNGCSRVNTRSVSVHRGRVSFFTFTCDTLLSDSPQKLKRIRVGRELMNVH